MQAPGSLPSPTSGQAQAINDMMRNALLDSSPRQRKNLGAFSATALGQTTRVRIFNVGVTTRFLLDVNATFDIGTAIAVLSQKAPFNFINRVKVTDFDGTDRINATGYQLWVWNSVRNLGQPYGYNNGSQTQVITLPNVPTAIAAAQAFRFMIEIPICYDRESDLRGAMLMQSAVGEAWINIDWIQSLAAGANLNDDALYRGAGTTTAILTAASQIVVNVFQDYLLPQAVNMGGKQIVPLPGLDLATVYEFGGGIFTTANISVGQQTLINLPNLRTVLCSYVNYRNNGVLNPATTDITNFQLIANGNNVLEEWNGADKVFEQRVAGNDADLRPGTYWFQSRRTPIQTAMYGTVQIGIRPSNVTNTNFQCSFEVGFESFYTKGANLPGIQTQ